LEGLAISEQTIKACAECGKEEVDNGDPINTATAADVAVSHALLKHFETSKIPAIVHSEESGKKQYGTNPEFLIGFDDIDGTENWRRSEGIMPYTTIIFVYDKQKPRFEDALVAAMLEHTSGHMWLAVRGEGCYFKKKEWQNFQRCETSGQQTLSRKTAVRLDLYAMREDPAVITALVEAAWVKDAGSSGYHLAAVSNGCSDAFVNSACKGHEFGAGYLLIKEAGGFIVDNKGLPYNKKPFDFDEKYNIVCTATEQLGRAILAKMK
jgi:fructose-1,6-bisphosphatase/inositol monophosphatase family enzyme